MKNILLVYIILAVSCRQNQINPPAVADYQEEFRPQYHFSPPTGWMNDPNGLVYLDGEYHLFYQYYPDSTIWGPMHWGHAVSKDLVHWKNLPIALFPDSLGYIFSGSAVADPDNTSGLASNGDTVLVSVFTYHNPEINGIGSQYQGIAYSNDKGRNWIKYPHNPVLPNPGLPDFRDPKVSWHQPAQKWIMTLAAGDHVRFYSSPDLKKWTYESDFGKNIGAQGGVWECPDLFEMPVENGNEKKWVLLVSINPGAPNGGSGTQYFIGSFDGHQFNWEEDEVKWIDYGMDNYAGVTWSNTGDRVLFIGWMSNWLYAQKVPTHPWRSAMTLPRELSLVFRNNGYYLHSLPVPEADQLDSLSVQKDNFLVDSAGFRLNEKVSGCKIELTADLKNSNRLNIEIGNNRAGKIIFGYSKSTGELLFDRTNAGESNFDSEFARSVQRVKIAPDQDRISFTVYIDRSSVELFFNEGAYVITNLVFPQEYYNYIRFSSDTGNAAIESLKIYSMKSIW